MSLESPISVRFPPAIKNRLSAIAERSGVSEAALIRMATEEFLTKVEAAKSITIKMADELREDAGTKRVAQGSKPVAEIRVSGKTVAGVPINAKTVSSKPLSALAKSVEDTVSFGKAKSG